jgi:hypothetical protein
MQKQKQNQTSIKRKNNLKKGKITPKKTNQKQVKRRKKEKKKTYVFQMDLLDKIAERTQASILANISNPHQFNLLQKYLVLRISAN